MTTATLTVVDESLLTTRRRIADKIRALMGKGCHRILLIQPLQISEELLDINIAQQKRYFSSPPYGLGMLNTALQQRRGYDVRLIDLNYHVLSMLQECTEVPSNEIRQLWQARMAQVMMSFRPDLVGISCMYTVTHNMMVRTANFAKEYDPTVTVWVGGQHPTTSYDSIAQEVLSIDFIALFECDDSFPDILEFANGQHDETVLRQVATLVDNQVLKLAVAQPPNLVTINAKPDYGDLPVGQLSDVGEIGIFRWWRNGASTSSVLSNRGCRAHCAFCIVRNFNGLGVRCRNVESVLDEIEDLRDRHGIQHITWLDDDLFFDEKRAIKLFNGMVQRNLGITWDASNGVIASSVAVHPEIVDAAVKSGCIALCFGIESGSPEILRSIHKPSGIKHFLKIGVLLHNYPSVFTKGFLIIGFPYETIGQLRLTIDLATKMSLDWFSVQLLTPLPSTELYDHMVAHGLLTAGTLNVGVRESDRQRQKEKIEQPNFFHFDHAADTYIPSIEELQDIWFDLDYRINYPKLLTEQDATRLRKAKYYLTDICDRMTVNNPLTNLFLAIVLEKIGEYDAARNRKIQARTYLESSNYWLARFKDLNLMRFL